MYKIFELRNQKPYCTYSKECKSKKLKSLDNLEATVLVGFLFIKKEMIQQKSELLFSTKKIVVSTH